MDGMSTFSNSSTSVRRGMAACECGSDRLVGPAKVFHNRQIPNLPRRQAMHTNKGQYITQPLPRNLKLGQNIHQHAELLHTRQPSLSVGLLNESCHAASYVLMKTAALTTIMKTPRTMHRDTAAWSSGLWRRLRGLSQFPYTVMWSVLLNYELS